MTLHGFVTNAAKHGSLSVSDGAVTVVWHVETTEKGTRRLRMNWLEDGGQPAFPPMRKGFGTRLVGVNIERELAGVVSLDFAQPGGLRVAIHVPLHVPVAGYVRPLAGPIH